MWRSPVAHLYGVQVVGGSNPLTPTKTKRGRESRRIGSLPRFVPLTWKAYLAKIGWWEQNLFGGKITSYTLGASENLLPHLFPRETVLSSAKLKLIQFLPILPPVRQRLVQQLIVLFAMIMLSQMA